MNDSDHFSFLLCQLGGRMWRARVLESAGHHDGRVDASLFMVTNTFYTNLECESAGKKPNLSLYFQFCQVKCVENIINNN